MQLYFFCLPIIINPCKQKISMNSCHIYQCYIILIFQPDPQKIQIFPLFFYSSPSTASVKSAIRSSMSSIPTLMRMLSSYTPASAIASGLLWM